VDIEEGEKHTHAADAAPPVVTSVTHTLSVVLIAITATTGENGFALECDERMSRVALCVSKTN
jgi:hypothetical protein